MLNLTPVMIRYWREEICSIRSVIDRPWCLSARTEYSLLTDFIDKCWDISGILLKIKFCSCVFWSYSRLKVQMFAIPVKLVSKCSKRWAWWGFWDRFHVPCGVGICAKNQGYPRKKSQHRAMIIWNWRILQMMHIFIQKLLCMNIYVYIYIYICVYIYR